MMEVCKSFPKNFEKICLEISWIILKNLWKISFKFYLDFLKNISKKYVWIFLILKNPWKYALKCLGDKKFAISLF